MESTLIASWAGMLGLSILVVIILTVAYVYVSARDREKLKEIKETGEWEGTTYDKNHKAIAPIRERRLRICSDSSLPPAKKSRR